MCDWARDLDFLESDSSKKRLSVNASSGCALSGGTEIVESDSYQTLNNGTQSVSSDTSTLIHQEHRHRSLQTMNRTMEKVPSQVALAASPSLNQIKAATGTKTVETLQEDSRTLSDVNVGDSDSEFSQPINYRPSLALGPEEDAIIRQMFKDRRVVVGGPDGIDEAAESERLRRMYIMARSTKKYKRLQVEQANSQWQSEIDMALDDILNPTTNLTVDGSVESPATGASIQHQEHQCRTENDSADSRAGSADLTPAMSSSRRESQQFPNPAFLRLLSHDNTPIMSRASSVGDSSPVDSSSPTHSRVSSQASFHSGAGCSGVSGVLKYHSPLRSSTASLNSVISGRPASRRCSNSGACVRRVSFSTKNVIVHPPVDAGGRLPPRRLSSPNGTAERPRSGLYQVMKAFSGISPSSTVSGCDGDKVAGLIIESMSSSQSVATRSSITISVEDEMHGIKTCLPINGPVEEVDYNDIESDENDDDSPRGSAVSFSHDGSKSSLEALQKTQEQQLCELEEEKPKMSWRAKSRAFWSRSGQRIRRFFRKAGAAMGCCEDATR